MNVTNDADLPFNFQEIWFLRKHFLGHVADMNYEFFREFSLGIHVLFNQVKVGRTVLFRETSFDGKKSLWWEW